MAAPTHCATCVARLADRRMPCDAQAAAAGTRMLARRRGRADLLDGAAERIVRLAGGRSRGRHPGGCSPRSARSSASATSVARSGSRRPPRTACSPRCCAAGMVAQDPESPGATAWASSCGSSARWPPARSTGSIASSRTSSTSRTRPARPPTWRCSMTARCSTWRRSRARARCACPHRSGKRLPVHCTGVGKALVAFLPEEVLKGVIARRGMPRMTAHTITDPAMLQAELAQVRERGYAVDNEEIDEGLTCIAAVVRDHTSHVVAAISIAGPSSRLRPETLARPRARGGRSGQRHVPGARAAPRRCCGPCREPRGAARR